MRNLLLLLLLFLHLCSHAQQKDRAYEKFNLLVKDNNYREAIRVGERLLKSGNHKKFTVDHAVFILSLGHCYYFTGQYGNSANLADEGKSIILQIDKVQTDLVNQYKEKNISLEFDEDYSTTQLARSAASLYYLLATHYKEQADYTRSLSLYESITSLHRMIPVKDYYASAVNQLSGIYSESGRFAAAEALCFDATEEFRKQGDTNSVVYASILHQQALLFTNIGKFNTALRLYIKSSNLFKSREGSRSINYLHTLTTIAYLYSRMGSSYEKLADSVTKLVGKIAEQNKDQLPDEYIAYLLAPVYQLSHQNKFATADSLINLAANMLNNHPLHSRDLYINYLDRRAFIALNKQEYVKADSLYEASKKFQRDAPGGIQLPYAWTLHGQATLHMQTGNYAEAAQLILEKNAFQLLHLKNDFQSLTEASKISYLDNNYFNSMASTGNNLILLDAQIPPSFIKATYNIEILTKSLVLDHTGDLLQIIRKENDSSLLQTYYQWKLTRDFVYQSRLSNSTLTRDSLLEETERLESILSRRSPNFKLAHTVFNISFADIQQQLEPDEAAVEFVNFRVFNKGWTDSILYAAYIVTRNNPVPVFVPLFEQRKLLAIFDTASNRRVNPADAFYRDVLKISRNNVNALGSSLYDLIWKPLEIHLQGIKKIAYAPTGKLYAIAFHSLKYDSSHLLLDRYTLRQYSSTRQVALRSSEDYPVPDSVLLFGDPLFAMDSAQLTTAAVPADRTTRDGNGFQFPPLPPLEHTRFEVNAIEAILKERNIVAHKWLGAAANEKNFKAIDGHPAPVIHIASHAFAEAASADNQHQLFQDGTTADPLLRCGFYLAGADYTGAGNKPIPNIEDGIVTAYEILQLDLTSTKLAVLSACRTALGDIREGEGIFGLQRAFKLAGVQKMIVSLWEVPDEETAVLMKLFYQYWKPGTSIATALDLARQEMRKTKSPYYWAAFVLVE